MSTATREPGSRFPILTGRISRRAAGARIELQRRADAAFEASRNAEDDREAAALRGKAHGLREAVDLVRALETGRSIGRRRRTYPSSRGPER